MVLCCNHAASINAQTNQNASGHPGIAQAAIVWDTPSTNSLGSMPIGNGDIGANVWVEPTGDLLLLLSKTDAYDEFGRCPKENENNGTHHGWSSVQFVLGGRVNGGLHGVPVPVIDVFAIDGPEPTLDYRSLYTTMIENWWGGSARGIFIRDFKPINLLLT